MASESGIGQQLSLDNLNSLEKLTTEGDSPVFEKKLFASSILSRAGHVKSCLNLPGPSGKAKY